MHNGGGALKTRHPEVGQEKYDNGWMVETAKWTEPKRQPESKHVVPPGAAWAAVRG